VLALLLLLPLAIVALTPLLLIQRYRAGSARRLARPWLATANVAGMIFSACFFVVGAGVTNFWVPNAFISAAAGVAVGTALGVIGLWVTRWEATPRALHYTPNRWLVLAITLVVAVRVLYGFWRGWTSWRSTGEDGSFIAGFGVAGSLGAGGTVLGYYVAYAIGVRRRISRWQKRELRVM
jgi:hypothetical protein